MSTYDGVMLSEIMTAHPNQQTIKKLYESKGITLDKEVIAYCRVVERSSHSWFVLKYLLRYPNVKNYDGSWTEWDNITARPIEK